MDVKSSEGESMHIRRVTRAAPAPAAVNLEQLLFIGNGVVDFLNSIIGLGRSAISFWQLLASPKEEGTT